jgi:hypothetical protein
VEADRGVVQKLPIYFIGTVLAEGARGFPLLQRVDTACRDVYPVLFFAWLGKQGE